LLVAAIERFATIAWDADSLHQATIEIGETMELPLRRAQRHSLRRHGRWLDAIV